MEFAITKVPAKCATAAGLAGKRARLGKLERKCPTTPARYEYRTPPFIPSRREGWKLLCRLGSSDFVTCGEYPAQESRGGTKFAQSGGEPCPREESSSCTWGRSSPFC